MASEDTRLFRPVFDIEEDGLIGTNSFRNPLYGMRNIAMDGIRFIERPNDTPDTPPDGMAVLYTKTDAGVTKLYFKDDAGNERLISFT